MVKQPKSKISKKIATPKPAKIRFITLLQKTWLELSTFWRTLVGITAVYAALYFVFVMGLSITNSLRIAPDESDSRLLRATLTIIDSLSGTYAGSESDATVIVQSLLFLIAALAIIWALRKLQALKSITIRDAYYQGPAALIPVIMVSVTLILMLVPAALGASILAITLQMTSFSIGVVLAVVAVLLLFFASAYMFTMLWPAFYIVTLPNVRPMQAFKSSRDLTKKRRFMILHKFILLGLLLLLGLFIVLFPFGLAAPTVVPYVVYIALFAMFLFSQVYLYELYRSLL